jgi:hypothetical protein
MNVFFAAFILAAHAAGATSDPVAKVTNVAGSVTVGERHAAVNDNLFDGETVTTGSDSSLKMIFKDDSVVDVGAGSKFKITHFESSENWRQGTFSLLYGKIRALVTKSLGNKSSFKVNTSTALMGVRGTELVVESGKGTKLTVISGEVGVSSHDHPEVMVKSGESIGIAGPGQIGAPRALTPGELSAVAKSSRIRDSTFDRTVTMKGDGHAQNKPSSASPLSAALEHTKAHAAASMKSAPASVVKAEGAGVFGISDQFSDPPTSILPGSIRTIDIHLSH